MKFCLSGACGFIGSNFCEKVLTEGHQVINLDKVTYAGHHHLVDKNNYKLIKVDISQLQDRPSILREIEEFEPDYLVHFAAESHVDRSLENSKVFMTSNIIGTWAMLELLKKIRVKKAVFLSTDETYGSFEITENFKSQTENHAFGFKEDDILNPRNPYAGSKAAADQLTISYVDNFKLPIIIVRPSNNFGPLQNGEKLLPKIISNIKNKVKVPIYSKGENYREWLYVADTCSAISLLLDKGNARDIYNIGSGIRLTNLEILERICHKLSVSLKDVIELVPDRLNHDQAYSLDSSKIRELGWKPTFDLNSGLDSTIEYYLKTSAT